ncbi:MAG: FtsX-like permease family protein, partial [Gemmatimonadaceae bacterium]
VQGTAVVLASAMKEGGLQGGPRRARLRSTFVVAQIALSVVLLAVAGLFARALQHALTVDPGFDAMGVVVAQVSLTPHGYDEERGRVLFDRLLERLRSRPEVVDASLAAAAPLSGNQRWSDAKRPERPGDQGVQTQHGAAGVGLLELLRVPLLAGRTFTNADGPGAPPVAVINETLARRLWPSENVAAVLGREFELDGGRHVIVGVTTTGKYLMPQEGPTAFAYYPFAQDYSSSPTLFIRTRGEAGATLRAAREEMAVLDPNIALERQGPLSEWFDRYLGGQQIGASLIGAFGLVGLLLAAAGIYAVLAYSVAQRMREFGVRMALGARAGDVVHLVVRHGLVLVAVGIALGLGGAFAAGRLVSSFLFGLSPADPVTLLAVPLVLVAVALLACAVPARRAAAADPMTSLRAE